MVDIVTKAKRSEMMSRIRGSNTIPEIKIRSMLHRKGYRFRLHRKDLPGKPDIVLPRFRTAIFVHGCFWHRHEDCPYAYTPKTRKEFWSRKFDSNVRRDRVVRGELVRMGWQVVTVWECETRSPTRLWERLEPAIQGH
ncbi:MAG: DNA mismatch endonuclease Vsr [Nitrospirae bacterium]|nr:DNA mismatch endonuclease Vsr [Nitrospirota bacterium]